MRCNRCRLGKRAVSLLLFSEGQEWKVGCGCLSGWKGEERIMGCMGYWGGEPSIKQYLQGRNSPLVILDVK